MKDPNENRPGYKQTKAGWIPQEWECARFDKLLHLQRGFDLPQANRKQGNIPVFASNGLVGYHNEAKVSAPGIVTGRSGSIGKVAFIEQDFWPLNTTLFVTNFHGNSPLYTFHFLQHFKLERFSNGTGVPTLNRNDVHSRQITFPPLPEQQKIADILSTWDEAIEQTRKLIDAKKRRKKGLMQQLLTGRKRLPGFQSNWEERILGDLVKPISRPVPKPNIPYQATGIRSHGKGTFTRMVDDPTKVAMDTLYEIQEGDLIVNITFAWEGAIAIVSEKDSDGLVSHRFPTYEIRHDACDREFLKQLILTQRFVWDLGIISPGGAGRNRVLNQKDFLKMKLLIPSQAEQHEIGCLFIIADREITYLEAELKAFEKQKRGLMQKLLTGEVRVKP